MTAALPIPLSATTRPPRQGPARRGLLLFAHGARDPQWARPFQAVADAVAAGDPQCPVRLTFLEFMSPDLMAAGADLAESGCIEVDVVPLFLGAGGHVRKDLPALLDRLREQHGEVTWTLHRAVGEEPLVIRAMAAAALARPAVGAGGCAPQSEGTDR